MFEKIVHWLIFLAIVSGGISIIYQFIRFGGIVHYCCD